MRRCLMIPLTPGDKAVYAKWSRRVLAVWAVIVIATLTLPIFRSDPSRIAREQEWDRAAEFPVGSVNHFTRGRSVER